LFQGGEFIRRYIFPGFFQQFAKFHF
jgi:hypothetical protein